VLDCLLSRTRDLAAAKAFCRRKVERDVVREPPIGAPCSGGRSYVPPNLSEHDQTTAPLASTPRQCRRTAQHVANSSAS
jgi:hypothetical protein